MLRMVYQNHQRWLRWTVPVLLAVSLAAAYAMHADGRHTWFSQLGLTYWALMSSFWARQPLFILTDDLLVIRGLVGPEQRIPLARADVRRAGRGWLVSWRAGKLTSGQEIRVPEPFATQLQAAIAAAKTAGPRIPGIVRAMIAVAPRWYPWAMGGALALVLLGIAINQPLLLAPCYALGVWSATWNRSYLLAGDQLRILAGDRVAATIPVIQIEIHGEHTLVTAHPGFAHLYLPKRAPSTAAFLQDLRDVQSGTLAPFGQALPQPSVTPDGPRCTLCGAHLGEAPAVHAASLTICPACADRTRYEAVQSGHGLITAKSRPPM